MKKLLALLHKDFSSFLSDPVAMALSFAVPLVMIVIFGFVFGRSGSDTLSEMNVLAVNEDAGPAGKRLLHALDKLDEIHIIQKLKNDSTALDSVRARKIVAAGRFSVALIVPRDFSVGLKDGQVRLSLLKDPRDPITAGVVEGLLKQQVFTTFPGLMPAGMMRHSWGGDSLQTRGFNSDLRHAVEKNFAIPLPESLSLMQALPDAMLLGRDEDTTKSADTSGFNFGAVFDQIFHFKSEAVVGQNIVNPGIAQSVAGPAVMFLLFAVGAIAASLLREMHYGTAQRLMISGVHPAQLLVSKYLYAVLFGSGQLIVMMLFGRLIFHLDIASHPGTLFVMIVCTAAATSSLGLLIAAISRTEEQAAGYGIVMNLGMSAIGGAMFPSFMIPAFIRTLAKATPVHWAMQGFLDVFWRNQSIGGIALECAILLGMAILFVSIAVLLFRKRLAVEFG
jgi:ABC-2 type transport system permease protein